MMKDKILVIDDEAGIRSSLKGILEDEGYEVKATATGEKGLGLMKEDNFDLVFLDILLPEMNGIEVLEKITSAEEETQVVIITAHGSIDLAVKATKMGAFDFLEKPLTLEKVVLCAKNAMKQKKLEEENIQFRERMRAKYRFIGKSVPSQKIREEVRSAAPTNGRVLIYGENGTGKELVARLIHQESPRKNKRFIQINCAAIPEDLIEPELFGYVKGALPNADKDKKGKLLLSDGGTLFLDEVCELSLKVQAKLVRVIEEQKFEPIGSSESIRIDTRMIAATDKLMKDLIARKKFREDLYFKLNVIPMHIPPLRERKEDIPSLIDYFLNYFALESGKKKKTMSKEAMEAFVNYSWPGNVSEIINVIERFVIMIKDDTIKSSHLSLLVEPMESQFIPGLSEINSLEKATEQFEREYIHRILVLNKWNLSKTASELKIERRKLDKKIVSLGITFLG
ncbi:MAG: sigma-54-dependent Fis family transcriptional regulator [Candidatus Aminicenantes bacterium]|nr:sigma-54-dependent Fis family transcriptional regulator [Candidatus Aminicenantes bacterium]